MSQILGKFIADGAITPSKLNTANTFEVGGLIVDSTNAVGNVAVGIGSALDRVHIRATSVRSGLRLDLDDGANGRTYQIASKSNGTLDISDIDSTKSRITVSSLGRVGFTTDDPQDLLHAVADSSSAGLRLDLDDGALGRTYRLVSDSDGAFKVVDIDSAVTRLLISQEGDTTVTGNLNVSGDITLDDLVLDQVNMNDATLARTLTVGTTSYLIGGVGITSVPKGRGLQVSTSGSVVHSGTGTNIGLNVTRNAYWNGTGWYRLVADNDAGRVYLDSVGGLSYSVNTDASSTVDSEVTFGTSLFEVSKTGITTMIDATVSGNLKAPNIISNMVPLTGSVYNLGSNSYKWMTGYFVDVTSNGTIQLNAINTGMALTSGNITGDLISTANITYNLGYLDRKWNYVYAKEISAGSAGNLTLSANGNILIKEGSDLIPETDNTSRLGSSIKKWSNLYVYDTTVSDIVVSGYIKSNLYPSPTGTKDLGDPSQKWQNISCSANIYMDGNLVPIIGGTSTLGTTARGFSSLYFTEKVPVNIAVVDNAGGDASSLTIKAGNSSSTVSLKNGGALSLSGGDSLDSSQSVGGAVNITGGSGKVADGTGGNITLTPGGGAAYGKVWIYSNVEISDIGAGADLVVGGTLSKGAGSFLIDHPLDPENKVLRHSFVESPEMRNLYFGKAFTVEGTAEIILPDWWTALNGSDCVEYTYNLTPIGTYSNLYISKEIENNRFEVTSLDGDCKFSWMVSAIRHDKFAEEHRIIVEEYK